LATQRVTTTAGGQSLTGKGDELMANDTASVLQGLQQYTLVAGKTTALRLFMDDTSLASADHVEANVLRPGGTQVRLSWPLAEFVAIPNSSAGPSIVVRVAGWALPWIGTYEVNARVLDAAGSLLAAYDVTDVVLLPTKDLRVMVSRVWSGTPSKPGETQAAIAAMNRLAALYPVRDGVSRLDDDYTAGLRYDLDDNPTGPPNQDGNLGPSWDRYMNRPHDVDSIDVAITYRFPNDSTLPPPFGAPDEPPPGAGASTKPAYKGLRWSLIVWKPPFAGAFCQETCHGFGLEPPQDPHVNLGAAQGVHSKDLTIKRQDAELGFDPQLNEAWPDPTFDLMYPTGPNPGYADGVICLNSWDWEYLRTQLAQLPSTGPTSDPVRLDALDHVSGARSLAGYYARGDEIQHVIVGTKDRAMTEVWWKPGQGVHQDVLSQFGSDIESVAGYYADDDGRQHAIAATRDGTLTELHWRSS